MTDGKKRGGFAAMSPERRRELASKGGKAAHERGTAHQFNGETAALAGKKGGLSRKKRKKDEGVTE